MFAIAVTTIKWFEYLRDFEITNRVNFWTPTPWGIRSLPTGSRFYFLLKNPIRKVGGYGIFNDYIETTLENAWRVYGNGNGCSNVNELKELIEQYTRSPVDIARHKIGCVELANCVYWKPTEFKAPANYRLDFPRQVVKFKYFHEQDPFL